MMINDPQLFIVPTPIGNLGDITIRAIDTLKNSDLILSEDTRHAKKLLSHYKISTKVKSYHLNNEHKKVDEYVEMMLQGKIISLITDAGTSPWSWETGIGENIHLPSYQVNNLKVIGTEGSLEFPNLRLWEYKNKNLILNMLRLFKYLY